MMLTMATMAGLARVVNVPRPNRISIRSSIKVIYSNFAMRSLSMLASSALQGRAIRASTRSHSFEVLHIASEGNENGKIIIASENPTFYADSGIDRSTELRADPKWIANAFNDPKALVLPVLGNKSIVKSDKAVLVSAAKLNTETTDASKVIFLGLTTTDRLPVFAVNVKDLSSSDGDWQKEGEWVDIRRYGPELQASDAGLLAYARGMVEWNSRNRFCGICGSSMISNLGGHSLKCSSSSCQNSIYPRLDPAVIMLVTCGKYILLGRQQKWEQGRYSLLAGFVEVGETFEQAVIREVKEEANINVEPSSIKYVASQPWPFPSSLMVGFVGEVEKQSKNLKKEFSEDEILAGADEFESLPKVVTDPNELEDARWVHEDFLKAVLLNKSPCHSTKLTVPGKHAIARFLMERWIESEAEETWAGKDVQTTEIDEGKFKYVLIRIKDDNGNQKLVVRGDKALPFHVNILEALQKEVTPLGLQVEPMGGGKIEHFPEQRLIHVFGASQAYGPANHRLTSSILRQSFPLYNISISAEDL